MFTKVLFAVATLAGSAYAESCAEAARFGTLTFSPDPIVFGQEITFTGDFTCAIELGYTPVYTDYFLAVPASNNSGFQPPVYFARRDGPSSGVDTFTVTFDPTYFAFTEYPDAQYEIEVQSTHAADTDSTYGSTLTTGAVIYPVSVSH